MLSAANIPRVRGRRARRRCETPRRAEAKSAFQGLLTATEKAEKKYIYIYKGSAWVPAGNHAPDRKYTSVPRRVFAFKEVVCVPLDLATNTIRALPSGAGKRYCRGSVLSFRIYLSHSNYIPTFIFSIYLFGTFFFPSFSAIYSEAQKLESSTRYYLWARKSST